MNLKNTLITIRLSPFQHDVIKLKNSSVNLQGEDAMPSAHNSFNRTNRAILLLSEIAKKEFNFSFSMRSVLANEILSHVKQNKT